VQEPEKAVAKPIIFAFRSDAFDKLGVLKILKKAMGRPNRQIACFRDLGNAAPVYRRSDALKHTEVAFQRSVAFADQLGLCAESALLTRPLRKTSLSNNQEFFPLFEKMEIAHVEF
jgi:hypothetical protein